MVEQARFEIVFDPSLIVADERIIGTLFESRGELYL